MTKQRGQLIVIEGSDGSGKTTQSELLQTYLKKQQIDHIYVDFPQYETFFGQIVARFLRGEFGSIDTVSPYLASLAFALDQSTMKDKINKARNAGKFVLTNRYATSNMAHQGSKFKSHREQMKYVEWVKELEYKWLEVPQEDKVIYLYVPWQIGMELGKKKNRRAYLHGKNDIHEQDSGHLADTEKLYLRLCDEYDHWTKIDCTDKNGNLLSPEVIHDRVIQELKLDSLTI
jgi:dTMP kinase